MQMVIEIPDDEYKMLVNPYQWNESQCMQLKEIVRNGTSLDDVFVTEILDDIGNIESEDNDDRSGR